MYKRQVQAQAAGTPALLSDRVTREVDFGAGLVDYARLEDCEDWLREAKALAGRRVSRENTGRIPVSYTHLSALASKRCSG